MYPWFKVLDASKLNNMEEGNTFESEDWQSAATKFVAELQIGTNIFIKVDLLPLLVEFVSSGFSISGDEKVDLVVGEGWHLIGTPEKSGYELNISMWPVDQREPVVTKHLSKDEMMLFVATKISETVGALERLGIDVESYVEKFPPSQYFRRS